MAEPSTSARSQAAMAISHKAEQHVVDSRRIVVVAGLGQVAAGHQAQPGAEGLQQHGHGVAHQQHPDQR